MEKLYILGHPIAHSKSPVMYNALYPKLGLDWEYGFMDLPDKEEARHFIEARDYLSINITTPFKPLAYECADYKAASAQLARGANLLVVRDGNLIAYNTDGQGCVSFLEHENVVFADRKVAVCGTGPTSLSILIAAVQAGASEVLLLGRDKSRAQAEISKSLDTYEHLASTAIDMPSPTDGHPSFVEAYERADFKFGSYGTSTQAIAAADIIIDATPLGMKEGDPAPFDVSLLHAGQVVLDTVYGHGETALVRGAQEAGAQVFSGAGMLVGQAVVSATIVCEVSDVELDMSYDEMFSLMTGAADFRCETLWHSI